MELHYVAMPTDERKTKTPRKGQKKESVETLLFNTDTHSGKELRHYKFLSVSFMARLLASHSFVSKVAPWGGRREARYHGITLAWATMS